MMFLVELHRRAVLGQMGLGAPRAVAVEECMLRGRLAPDHQTQVGPLMSKNLADSMLELPLVRQMPKLSPTSAAATFSLNPGV